MKWTSLAIEQMTFMTYCLPSLKRFPTVFRSVYIKQNSPALDHSFLFLQSQKSIINMSWTISIAHLIFSTWIARKLISWKSWTLLRSERDAQCCWCRWHRFLPNKISPQGPIDQSKQRPLCLKFFMKPAENSRVWHQKVTSKLIFLTSHFLPHVFVSRKEI